MKLNKTWMGICVWLIYVVGMIFAIGVTSFVSGLFSAYGKYTGVAAITVISLLSAFILSFAGCSIGKKIASGANMFKGDKAGYISEILFPLMVIICGAILYPIYMRVAETGGNMALINSAIVTEKNVSVVGS
nr:hypothetical protein [Lachnospiraceae bacterium]